MRSLSNQISDNQLLSLEQQLQSELQSQSQNNAKLLTNFKYNSYNNQLNKSYENPYLKNLLGITQPEQDYIDQIQNQITQIENQQSFNNHQTHNSANKDDILCQICNDGDYTDDNLIVICSKCNMSVHQSCYLISYIPKDDWICDLCHFDSPQPISCPLCPNKNGPLKQTNIKYSAQLFPNNESYTQLSDIEYVWVHMSCFYWLPESYLDSNNQLKGLLNIDQKRFNVQCNICNLKNQGISIYCSQLNCFQAYHPECARRSFKYMSSSITKYNSLQYHLYCDKHIPLKLNRLLSSKAKQYQQDIYNFNKSFEKLKTKITKNKKFKLTKHKLKSQRISKLLFKQPLYNSQTIIEFATYLKSYLETLVQSKFIIDLSNSNQIIDINIPPLENKPHYYLRDLPTYHILNENQTLFLPFYKSTIPEFDELWDQLSYQNYASKELYEIYQIAVRRASRYMQELNPIKKQLHLFDLLTTKRPKMNQNIILDPNPYCFCRQSFIEGQKMICCENCEEWFHFHCLGLQCDMAKAESLIFYCFLCYDELEDSKKRKKISKIYKKFVSDPKFILQRQIAKKTNYDEIRKDKLIQKIEDSNKAMKEQPQEIQQVQQIEQEQEIKEIQQEQQEQQEQTYKNQDQDKVQEEQQQIQEISEKQIEGQQQEDQQKEQIKEYKEQQSEEQAQTIEQELTQGARSVQKSECSIPTIQSSQKKQLKQTTLTKFFIKK